MSNPARILLIAGSLRERSTNSAVIDTAASLKIDGIETYRYDAMKSLPHFNPDEDFDPLPELVIALREQIVGAGAVMICTPEYAGALPGAFKNLLDWTIGGAALYEKRVAWINCAQPGRGLNAIDSLHKVLGYAGAEIIEAACADIPVPPDAIGEDGLIADQQIRAAIEAALAELAG